MTASCMRMAFFRELLTMFSSKKKKNGPKNDPKCPIDAFCEFNFLNFKHWGNIEDEVEVEIVGIQVEVFSANLNLNLNPAQVLCTSRLTSHRHVIVHWHHLGGVILQHTFAKMLSVWLNGQIRVQVVFWKGLHSLMHTSQETQKCLKAAFFVAANI